MDEQGRGRDSVVFVGDLADPWVAGLAAGLPAETRRVSCAGELPAGWVAGVEGGTTLVLHRAVLDGHDAERVRQARRAGVFSRVVLCVGPHARYHHVQRWSALVDAVLPEATAAELLPRYVGVGGEGTVGVGACAVVSVNRELREALAAGCRGAGIEALAVAGWAEVPAGAVGVWDVPVLEPGWARRLAEEATRRRVVALIGFADRRTVGQARAAGASACLDLPCDPADLAFVLRRVARGLQSSGRIGREAGSS